MHCALSVTQFQGSVQLTLWLLQSGLFLRRGYRYGTRTRTNFFIDTAPCCTCLLHKIVDIHVPFEGSVKDMVIDSRIFTFSFYG